MPKLIIVHHTLLYTYVPDLHVTVLGKEYHLRNDQRIELELEEGEYDMRFQSTVHTKDRRVSLHGDTKLSVGLNRLTGAIEIG